MARAITKIKEDFNYFKNNEGLNTNATRFDRREGQCIENENLIYPKMGGFKSRGGQIYVTANQAAGNPNLLYGIEFVRTEFGVTTRKKIAFGADGNVYDYSVNPPNIILAGLTLNTQPDVVVVHGWLCFVNGVDQPRKWNMTNWYRWGIEAPVTAPTLAAGAAGNPNGTYRFRISFGRTPGVGSIDPGAESSMGTISAPITVVTSIINLTNIPTSADPQVNTRYVYVEIGGQWYRAGTINDNITTTFSYNLFDSTAVLNTKGRLDRDPIDSANKYVEFHKDIIFATNQRFLDWSALDEFEAFSTGGISFNRRSNAFETDDGTKITGLKSHIDLVVAKERVLFIRAGDDITYTVTKKVNNSGCDARFSMVVKDDRMFYHAHDGFRVFDGNDSRLIQRNIQNLITGQASERVVYTPGISRIVGAYYSNNLTDAVLWAVPTSASESNRLFYYSDDFQTLDSLDKETKAVGVWAEWTNLDAKFLFVGKDPLTNFDLAYTCGRDGFMRQIDVGYTDLGAPINCVYRQVDLYFGRNNSYKRLRDSWFVVSIPEGAPTGVYQVEWFINGITSGIIKTIDFCVTGARFDNPPDVFDVARFANEGNFTALVEYGPDPFITIAPRLTWQVTQDSDDVLWNGWTMRILGAGYRRYNC